MNKINVRVGIKKIFYAASASLVVVMSAFLFKDRHAIKAKAARVIANQPKVAFVNTSQPFAMIMPRVTFVKPKTDVETFQHKVPRAGVGKEFMAKHSKEIEHFVAANSHINDRRSHEFSMSQDDRGVQEAETSGTGFNLLETQGIRSFKKNRWWGPSFNFTFSFTFDLDTLTSKRDNQPVKPSETYSYAFSCREKLQRGDGTVNPFIPTERLARKSTLEIEADKIEQVISDVVSQTSSREQGNAESGSSEAGTALEGSRINVVQTGQVDELDLEVQAEAEYKKNVISGFANMIVNTHNTSLLEKLVNSPKFEIAAKLVDQEVAEEINQRLNAGPFTQYTVERFFSRISRVISRS